MGRPAKGMDLGGNPHLSHCQRCKEGRLYYTTSVDDTLEDMYECNMCGQPVFAILIDGAWEKFYPYVDNLVNEKKKSRTWSVKSVIRKYRERCDERHREGKHEGILLSNPGSSRS